MPSIAAPVPMAISTLYVSEMIAGVIMAAGMSERMAAPVPKQLLQYQQRPMVAVTATNAVASGLDLVVVVTGHRGDEVAAAITGTGVESVANPDYRQGNMTSLRAGYRALPPCDAYVLLLADMPGVSGRMIDRFVTLWEEKRPWAAVAAYRDGRGHPLLLSAAAMEAVIAETGSRAVWRLLDAAADDDVALVVFDEDAPLDVNTAEDYERLTE